MEDDGIKMILVSFWFILAMTENPFESRVEKRYCMAYSTTDGGLVPVVLVECGWAYQTHLWGRRTGRKFNLSEIPTGSNRRKPTGRKRVAFLQSRYDYIVRQKKEKYTLNKRKWYEKNSMSCWASFSSLWWWLTLTSQKIDGWWLMIDGGRLIWY